MRALKTKCDRLHGKGTNALAPTVYSSSQLRACTSKKPNPQPLPYKGRGVKIKASLLVGERFGERSECTASNREGLYIPCNYTPKWYNVEALY